MGPRRFFRNPVSVQDLPQLDAIVISHDHFDHLDRPTIQRLAPKAARFVVPMGVGAILAFWGIPSEKIVERDWWQSVQLGHLTLTAAPARHYSGRWLVDRDKTQWATWVIAGHRNRVCFIGDTGLCPSFGEIAERLGPFDISCLPIGAYGPGWPDIHMTPEEAVTAHQQLGGGLMLPLHWGTFDLALHPWTEPIERLVATAQHAKIRFATPQPGSPVVPTSDAPTVNWWSA